MIACIRFPHIAVEYDANNFGAEGKSVIFNTRVSFVSFRIAFNTYFSIVTCQILERRNCNGIFLYGIFL